MDSLPGWAAAEPAAPVAAGRRRGDGAGPRLQPLALTAADWSAIPPESAPLVDTVVEVPPLRARPDDVMALAHRFARRHRGHGVRFAPGAVRALTAY
ncbi:hypothetical protein AB0P07_04870 [Streptomyces sp. NPDC085944]|uniref:hypothetical protein n=1 Tax=Streptomyces sp. NPDC085944 TaxID=3154962 RepID=UPI00341C6556